MRKDHLLLLGALIFASDRVSKLLVTSFIDEGELLRITDFFSLVNLKNRGFAFGLLSNSSLSNEVLTLLPTIITFFLIYYLFRRANERERLPLVLVISGAAANLFDRYAFGYVIDFLDFHIGRFHWPAFNLADSSVTVGIALYALFELKKRGRDE